MREEKSCPMVRLGNQYRDGLVCVKESCSWWDDESMGCAVLVLAQETARERRKRERWQEKVE